MIERHKTGHICKCGKRAIVERLDTKEWFCLGCAAGIIAGVLGQGNSASVSVNGLRLNDVVVAPKENGAVDLLAALGEVHPIKVYDN